MNNQDTMATSTIDQQATAISTNDKKDGDKEDGGKTNRW